MFQKTSLLFDLSDLPTEDKTNAGLQSKHVAYLCWYNERYNTLDSVALPKENKVCIESGDSLIHLPCSDWYQLQLIKHLPPKEVIKFFLNRET